MCIHRKGKCDRREKIAEFQAQKAKAGVSKKVVKELRRELAEVKDRLAKWEQNEQEMSDEIADKAVSGDPWHVRGFELTGLLGATDQGKVGKV